MSQQRTVEDFAGRRAGSKQGLRQGVDAVGVPVDDGLLELVLHLISPLSGDPRGPVGLLDDGADALLDLVV